MGAMQQSLIATTGLAFVFDQTISSNTPNYNLKAAAIAAGWNQLTPLQARITINSGVYVSANSTGQIGFDTGATFPTGTQLSMTNNGFIIGMGAAGGNGAEINTNGASGSTGGLALRAQHAISINNASGTIGGGGGGGGGGAASDTSDPYGNISVHSGGGGGGGRTGATNSSGGSAFPGSGTAPTSGSNGSPGTSTAPGSGGSGGSGGGGSGGNGGQWGTAGNAGNGVTSGGQRRPAGGAGPAGAAVDGNSNITWINTGTRLGAIT